MELRFRFMDWTIEQLVSFVTSAEEGSFSAAARSLGRAQSVVSTHISMLEDALGVTLFDRSTRSPALTEAGRDLLPEAKAVLRQSRRFQSRAMAQFDGQAFKFSIAVSYGIPLQTISESVAALTQRYPYVSGEMNLASVSSVLEQVRQRNVHIGVVFSEAPHLQENCERMCLGQLQYCAVASRHSELAKLERVTAHDVSQHRQILLGDEGQQSHISSQYLVVNDIFCAAYWAALGIGWAALPLRMAQQASSYDVLRDLVVLNSEKVIFPVRNIFLLWSQDVQRRDVQEFFIQDLQARYLAQRDKVMQAISQSGFFPKGLPA